MNKIEFIKMLQQDNETQTEPKKTLHAQVIDCTIIALIDEAPDFEVDTSVTADILFQIIEREARSSSAHCVGPFQAAKLIAKRLNTKNDGVARIRNMAMGMLEGNAPTPRSKISLDDL